MVKGTPTTFHAPLPPPAPPSSHVLLPQPGAREPIWIAVGFLDKLDDLQ